MYLDQSLGSAKGLEKVLG